MQVLQGGGGRADAIFGDAEDTGGDKEHEEGKQTGPDEEGEGGEGDGMAGQAPNESFVTRLLEQASLSDAETLDAGVYLTREPPLPTRHSKQLECITACSTAFLCTQNGRQRLLKKNQRYKRSGFHE